MRLAQLYFKN